MSDDPYERARAIRKGDLDDEMPAFDELTGWFLRVPNTWLPGLLRRLACQCEMKKVFKDGGMQHLIDAAIRVGKDPQGSILRG